MKEYFKIDRVWAREILDCRGTPTIEVEVMTEGGVQSRADVPCGRSTGKNEAYELRDGGKRYRGKGVLKAVSNVNKIIAPALKGKDVTMQREIDDLIIELDGTSNKSNLGANALTGVSLAVAKTAAICLEIPLYRYIGGSNSYILPVPFLDLIEGGILAETNMEIQEHQVAPVGAKTFSEALRMGLEVYLELGEILAKRWGRPSLNVAVEGGYTPPMKDSREAIEAELKAIEELGYEDMFVLGLDVAASHFYHEETGKYSFMGKKVTREHLLDFYEDLVNTYPIQSIEDPLQEEDFEGFAEITERLDIQIIGDDLFTSNVERLKKGIEVGAANSLLLKVNQVGTLSEALDAAELAFRNGYSVQVSERSGQTEDTWLSDLSVGLNSGQIKTGVTRSERVAKYNQLFRIEEELGKRAKYAGRYYRRLF
jgi:enolase